MRNSIPVFTFSCPYCYFITLSSNINNSTTHIITVVIEWFPNKAQQLRKRKQFRVRILFCKQALGAHKDWGTHFTAYSHLPYNNHFLFIALSSWSSKCYKWTYSSRTSSCSEFSIPPPLPPAASSDTADLSHNDAFHPILPIHKN